MQLQIITGRYGQLTKQREYLDTVLKIREGKLTALEKLMMQTSDTISWQKGLLVQMKNLTSKVLLKLNGEYEKVTKEK